MNPKPHLLPPPDLRPVIGFQTLPGIGGAATAATPDGPVPMAWLRAGDLVVTRDRGLQPLLDIGRIDGPVPQMGGSTTHWPIRIAAGALGAGVPEADIVMSPDQPMLLRSAELELLFGLSEALVSARQLLGWGGVERIMPEDAAITYQPILEHHDLMLVDGCWTATLFLEPLDLIGLRDRAPDWAQHLAKGHLRPVRSALDDWEVSLLTPPVPAEVRRPAQVSQSA